METEYKKKLPRKILLGGLCSLITQELTTRRENVIKSYTKQPSYRWFLAGSEFLPGGFYDALLSCESQVVCGERWLRAWGATGRRIGPVGGKRNGFLMEGKFALVHRLPNRGQSPSLSPASSSHPRSKNTNTSRTKWKEEKHGSLMAPWRDIFARQLCLVFFLSFNNPCHDSVHY